VELRFIQPGKPVQNAYIESFNSRFRDECLSQHWFASLSHMRRVIKAWREDYNEHRPHSALGYLPPAKYAAALKAAKEKRMARKYPIPLTPRTLD
jgi:putative transposase